MVYIYYDNSKFDKQIQYTFKVLFNTLGIKIKFIDSLIEYINKNCMIINYSDHVIHSNNTITIKPSYLFSNLYLKKQSMPITPLKRYKGTSIIYTKYVEYLYVKKYNKSIVTNLDIIQSSFFMLTRYEEVILWSEVNRDMYERFPAKEGIAHKEGFLDTPIVNEYIEWLWEWLDYFNVGLERKNIWGKYDFAACLTHDVDNPFKYIFPFKNEIISLKNKNMFLAYRNIFMHAISNINYLKDPFFTFHYIRKVEKKYNFTSSFYFMSGGKTKYEGFYNIYDNKITNLIYELDRDKCEIGYHYSFDSFINLNNRKLEKNLLDKYVRNKVYGGRNHYLRFKVPESWGVSEEVGLLYDTTLGYAEVVGFRCGICLPYKVFDVLKNKELELWEIPLIVMEGTLRDEKYMNLSINKALEEIKRKIDIVKKYKGIFTLIWHNSSFDSENWKGWKPVFEDTMRYLYQNNALGTNGREIIKVFNNKGD